jgi:protein SCO1/2
MKTKLLLTVAFFVGGAWITPATGWAHEGHDHGAQAQRDRAAQAQDYAARADQMEVKSGDYARSWRVYLVPDVTLVNADARPLRLREVLAADGPVLMDFIYTSCTTICPVMSEAFSMVPEKLGPQAGKLRMISVSVDPENDRPAQLKAYARQYGASANWQFLTGNADDVETVLRAFDNYRSDKMAYGPVTLLRPARGEPWVRIDGFATADELAREYRNIVLK